MDEDKLLKNLCHLPRMWLRQKLEGLYWIRLLK